MTSLSWAVDNFIHHSHKVQNVPWLAPMRLLLPPPEPWQAPKRTDGKSHGPGWAGGLRTEGTSDFSCSMFFSIVQFIWLVVSSHSKNMKVNWDDYSQYFWENKSHVPVTTNQLSSLGQYMTMFIISHEYIPSIHHIPSSLGQSAVTYHHPSCCNPRVADEACHRDFSPPGWNHHWEVSIVMGCHGGTPRARWI